MNRLISWTIVCIQVASGVTYGEAAKQPNAWWPQFRGPNGTNAATSRSVSLEFGPDRHVLWKTELPPGNSSPVIWEDRVFVTAVDEGELLVLSYERSSGQLDWRERIPFTVEPDYAHDDCSPATPTSCTNGEQLISYFGDYGIVAHDLEGNALWSKTFAMEPSQFGFGSSPIIDGHRVYLLRDVGVGSSSLTCFDAATGKELWKRPRFSFIPSYSTPYLWNSSSGQQLVAASSGNLQAYNCSSGELIWSVKGLPAFVCPSPISSGDVLVFGAWTTAHASGQERVRSTLGESVELTEEEMTSAERFIGRFDTNRDGRLTKQELPASRARDAFRFLDKDNSRDWNADEVRGFLAQAPTPGRNIMVAVRAGGTGDITTSHTIWEVDKKLPYVASPVIHRGYVYYVKKGGFLTCVELETGKFIAQQRLRAGGEYYATPLLVGDRMIIAAERGTVFVVAASPELKILSTNKFAEEIAATPAAVDGKLYLRTESYLYSIGES